MKLISLSDYVSEMETDIEKYSTRHVRTKEYFDNIIKYNRFLKMPLTLEMFRSGKYFKDITIQEKKPWPHFYSGIRVYHFDAAIPIEKCFSEIFLDDKPRHHKTISDLVIYDLQLSESLIF